MLQASGWRKGRGNYLQANIQLSNFYVIGHNLICPVAYNTQLQQGLKSILYPGSHVLTSKLGPSAGENIRVGQSSSGSPSLLELGHEIKTDSRSVSALQPRTKQEPPLVKQLGFITCRDLIKERIKNGRITVCVRWFGGRFKEEGDLDWAFPGSGDNSMIAHLNTVLILLSLRVYGALVPGPLYVPTSKDAQVSWIKWCTICVKPAHILSYTLSSLDDL